MCSTRYEFDAEETLGQLIKVAGNDLDLVRRGLDTFRRYGNGEHDRQVADELLAALDRHEAQRDQASPGIWRTVHTALAGGG